MIYDLFCRHLALTLQDLQSLRLLQHQCLTNVASAPRDCSFCVQTALGQHAEVCSSGLAETSL